MIRKVILNSLYFSGVQKILSPHMRGMGSILMLHHVRKVKKTAYSPNYHLSASPEFLDKMITVMKLKGVQFLTMDEVADRLGNPDQFRDAPPFASITLDDGYRDNLENAIPVFHKHKVPYLVYIAPGLAEGEATLWWEDLERIIGERNHIHVDFPAGRVEFDTSNAPQKRKVYNDLIDYLLLEMDEESQRRIVADLCEFYQAKPLQHLRTQIMNWEEIHQLSKDSLCQIGAHTIGHYALAKLTDKKAETEMRQSREIIQSEIGISPDHLAYPYGFPKAAGPREFKLAQKCGFKTAVTTRHGMLYPEHGKHMFALPRVSVNGHHQSIRHIETLLSGVPTRLKNLGRKLNVD